MSDTGPGAGPGIGLDGGPAGVPNAAGIANSRALYSISVASELSGVDSQMLRVYEQRGLLSPFRTEGGTRRYSADDIERVATITALLGAGLNLAGIGHVLELRAQTTQLTDELGELRASTGPDRQEVRRLRQENQDLREEIARLEDPDARHRMVPHGGLAWGSGEADDCLPRDPCEGAGAEGSQDAPSEPEHHQET
jgi:MerR family transcriptional regulator/heat shock protein HspR